MFKNLRFIKGNLPRSSSKFNWKSIRRFNSISHTKNQTSFRASVYVVLTLSALALYGSGDFIRLDTEQRGLIPAEEVKEHNSLEKGLWVAINGTVYDLTEFAPQHPGGLSVILKHAGYDASKIFDQFHSKDVIPRLLPPEKKLGTLDGTLDELDEPLVTDEAELEERRKQKPHLCSIFNINEFEYVAKKLLPAHAWAYYSGGSDNEVTLRENHSAYDRIFFRPRVLVNVDDVDISTEMLGVKTDAPFYCSAAAQAKLGHPDGELSIAEGCGKENIFQMISNAASYTFDEITNAALPNQNQWFQLYVEKDRKTSFDLIKACEEKGIKGIFVTVDSAVFGRREKDLRFKITDVEDSEDVESNYVKDDFILSYKDIGLTWDDIGKFKRATNIPIVIKGVQRSEDVLLAIEHGVDGVVLSNHGGRQLDFSRAPVEVLAEVMPILRDKKLDNKIEIFVDGGVRRGSDIIKALCLGAKGVGLGRPYLYANAGYGKYGVIKATKLLKEEVIRDMKLLGVTKIEDLSPDLVDTRKLFSGFNDRDSSEAVYERLTLPKFQDED
ncbi:uncharacterized protein PRCAT00005832001 [Priceomyces carsonii]|uniref:uncharacterized protein n=1 Tax=Priceomyces carsonii TaxID=28549 RepID=UPI002ED9BE3B|nr:unnamed protein product [Priceomyces carsonii]